MLSDEKNRPTFEKIFDEYENFNSITDLEKELAKQGYLFIYNLLINLNYKQKRKFY